MERAFVDESEPGGGRDHTTYVLASVVVRDDRLEDARAAVAAATPRRMRKLHWYEALAGQRVSWLTLLQFAVSVLVIRYDGVPARAERRRRRCIERMVHELQVRQVSCLVLESRGSGRDAHDAAMIESLRSRGVGAELRYEQVRGSDEPLLALADIACGAATHGFDIRAAHTDVIVVS